MPDLLSILRKSADYLGGKGIDSPRVEAELLVAHALDLDRIALYLQFDKPLTDESLGPIREVLKRRVRGEPVQYITGKAGFYEIELAVGSGVLIPRPETERLVDRALVLYEGGPVLDLCTGSGAVILSLWHARQEDGPFVAVDLSPEALVWAEKNRASLEADVELLEGDLFAPVAGRTFTLITTNRPFSEWNEVFPNAACVVSLIDRLVHHSEVIAIEGDSYRMKEAKEQAVARGKVKRGKAT